MLTLLLTATTTALAGSWSPPKPFLNPILGGGVVSVNGNTHAQVHGGAAAGVRTRYKGGSIPWLSTSRVLGIGRYGLTSGSVGADFRLGSFIGPSWKSITFQHGPDLWYSGYGTTTSDDYFLRWSPGLDLYNGVTVRAGPALVLNGMVVPGWAFVSDRQQGGVGPFHELTAGGSASVNAGAVRLTVGYRKVWNAAGSQEFIILGAGI